MFENKMKLIDFNNNFQSFLINSKIKYYCNEICKGKCCKPCLAMRPLACANRTPCIVYLCSLLRDLIDKACGFERTDITIKILNKISIIIGNKDSFILENSIFFKETEDDYLNEILELEDNELDILNTYINNIEKIKEKVEDICVIY